MRQKMLLLAFALTALAASLSPRAEAASTTGPLHSCFRTCTTYPNGGQCCNGCMCDAQGHIAYCTDNICPA